MSGQRRERIEYVDGRQRAGRKGGGADGLRLLELDVE